MNYKGSYYREPRMALFRQGVITHKVLKLMDVVDGKLSRSYRTEQPDFPDNEVKKFAEPAWMFASVGWLRYRLGLCPTSKNREEVHIIDQALSKGVLWGAEKINARTWTFSTGNVREAESTYIDPSVTRLYELRLITGLEELVLGMVVYRTRAGLLAYQGNEHFAKRLGVSERRVKYILHSLEQKNLTASVCDAGWKISQMVHEHSKLNGLNIRYKPSTYGRILFPLFDEAYSR